VYATTDVFDTSVHICEHTLHSVCAVCSLAFGGESRRIQLVYAGHLLLVLGVIVDRRRDRGVIWIFEFLTGVLWVSKFMCVCVYKHTHTHAAHVVLRREPRGWDETPGQPEESRWTNSQDTYIRICVRSIHVYIYAGRRDYQIGLNVFYLFLSIPFLKIGKRCWRNTKNLNSHWFELDWYCFYYSVRNSLVALLEALFAT